VDIISRIRLSTRRSEDFVAWHPEKTGMFSVRSAYNLSGLERKLPRPALALMEKGAVE